MGEDNISYLEEFSIKSDYYPDNIIFNSTNTYIAISLVLSLTDHTNTASSIEIFEYKELSKTATQNAKK